MVAVVQDADLVDATVAAVCAEAADLRAHLLWRTEQDIPRTDVVYEVLRH